MNRSQIITFFIGLTIGLLPYHVKRYFSQPSLIKQSQSLNQAMRKLWSDHSIWTRGYIISAVSDAADKQAATERVLQNQVDLGNAIVPFYGREAGDMLTALLKDHILIAAALVEEAKKGNQAGVAEQNKKWHANADEIAKFLSGANPNWPEESLRDMLYLHLKLVGQEADLRIKQQWKKDIENFDENYKQALEMADALADGIVKQFPHKF